MSIGLVMDTAKFRALKTKALQFNQGVQITYFDTLVVRLVPCFDPERPATIEENLQARFEDRAREEPNPLAPGAGRGRCDRRPGVVSAPDQL